jgi:hypothetical protein
MPGVDGGMKEKPAVGRLLFICQVAAQKRKSPDTTPGFINNTLNLFVGVTTSNVFTLTDGGFSSCHQCWGQAAKLEN